MAQTNLIAIQEVFVGSKAQRGSLPAKVVAAVTKRTNQFPKAAEVTPTVLSLAGQDPFLVDPVLVDRYLAGLV